MAVFFTSILHGPSVSTKLCAVAHGQALAASLETLEKSIKIDCEPPAPTNLPSNVCLEVTATAIMIDHATAKSSREFW